jgi:HKD family nuclease
MIVILSGDRLAVARKLLELQRLAGHSRKQLDVAFDKRREQLQRRLAKKSNEKSKEKIRDELAAELAAQQTFKFISLLVPATLPFAEPDWDALIKARDYQRLWKKIQQRIKAGGEIKFTQLDRLVLLDCFEEIRTYVEIKDTIPLQGRLGNRGQ